MRPHTASTLPPLPPERLRHERRQPDRCQAGSHYATDRTDGPDGPPGRAAGIPDGFAIAYGGVSAGFASAYGGVSAGAGGHVPPLAGEAHMTDDELNRRFDDLARLIAGMKESLEREIQAVDNGFRSVSTRFDALDARLGRHAGLWHRQLMKPEHDP